MLLSAEVRWFKPGDPRDSLRRWFDVPTCGGGRPRVDVYSVSRSSDELGIKQREGRPGWEVKALVHPAVGAWQLGSLTGAFQMWTRCSCREMNPSSPAIVSTRKVRRVRIFDSTAGAVRELALGSGPFGEEPIGEARPVLGCHVELATVDVDGERWSTFGIQSFAEDVTKVSLRDVTACLEPLFAHLNVEAAIFDFHDWDEKSYPGWLQDLVRG